MSATIALARAELTMLARNRTAAVTAVLVPLGGGLWIVTDAPADTQLGSAATVAALQLLVVVGMTVTGTAMTTLVARRQQHVLERWRTSGAATRSVLAGTLAPLGVLLVVQAGILLTATGFAAGAAPSRPLLLALAVVLGGVLGGALGFVGAALTRTVEAASVTMLPLLAPLLGGGIWATVAGPGEVTWLMRSTGGGALAELVRIGWDGPADDGGLGAALTVAGPSVLALVALTAALVVAALRTFRWEARG